MSRARAGLRTKGQAGRCPAWLTIGIGIALACASGAGATPAPDSRKAPLTLSPADRIAPGGRTVRVTLDQDMIGTSVDIGRVALDSCACGAIGAIFLQQRDRKRNVIEQNAIDKAEMLAAPLRRALGAQNIGAVALATTRSALAAADWFDARDFILDDRAAATSGPLLVAGTAQIADIAYRYELSPDFTQIRVIADISMTRAIPGGQVQLMRQRIASIVELNQRSYDAEKNVARWSADHAALARAALDRAFARMAELIPAALTISAADAQALSARGSANTFAAGFYGTLVSRDADGTGLTIWSGGLVHVEPAGDSAP